jgi:hypothetical protein
MATLNTDLWNEFDPVLAAAVNSGFNLTKNLKKILQKAFPFFGDFQIGYFVTEDLPSRISMGWKQLRSEEIPDDFREDFNRAIQSSRFALRKEADSSIWFKNLSVCVMPQKVYDAIRAVQEEERRSLAKRAEAQFAMPDNPAAHTETAVKTWKVQNEPAEQKRPPGRPRKE